MSERGGAAAKFGNRYEAYWTVRQLLRVLAEDSVTIRIEPRGVEGVEFWLRTGAAVEFHPGEAQAAQGQLDSRCPA